MSATSERTLIDQLLEEQRDLTAVERFARAHAQRSEPALAKHYRELIPMTLPQAGEQYAFEVDLDKCSGCKACVTACHNLNGLGDNETWRSVGFLHGGTPSKPVQMTVTTACHHCVDPACSNGCPVLAYEKDPITGIVRHLDDQCIGCQYCALKCPYDAPQYNADKGIVRKCDMCSHRLSAGEAPACVQACPNEAIQITIVNQRQIATQTSTGTQIICGAADSSYALPTTQYKTAKPLPANSEPADSARLTPATAHPPLVPMLTLTQLSVGMLSIAAFSGKSFGKEFFGGALAAGILGLIASVFHLGQPMRAWRSFLGWRRSWLSREILAFGAFMPLAIGAVILQAKPLLIVAAVFGLVAVFTSVMVYADTNRAFWSTPRNVIRFFGTTLLLGLAASQAWVGVAVVGITKLIWEALALRPNQSDLSLVRSARLMTGPLRPWTAARFALATIGLCIGETFPMAGLAFLLAGEMIERHLFFIAVAPPKMPGGIAS